MLELRLVVDLGITIILFLFSWMAIEILTLIAINKKLAFDIFAKDEKEKSTKESRLYGNRALTLGGLAFAALSLLIGTSEDINSIKNTLIILVYAFSLLLCSYKIEVFTDKRIYWILQEKCLNFGYLTLIFALMIFFYEKTMYLICVIIGAFIIIIFIMQVKEFYTDGKYFYQRRKEGDK